MIAAVPEASRSSTSKLRRDCRMLSQRVTFLRLFGVIGRNNSSGPAMRNLLECTV